MPNITQTEISEQQLQNIITEVNSELENMFKSEHLAKARPGEETPGEGQEDSSKTDPAGENTDSASASPDPASASPDAAGSDSAPPADDASAAPPGDDGSAPPADGSAPGGDPAADTGPIDPQQLMAEYAQLPPEDLKAHYLACKEALIQVLGAPGADAGSAAPPADPSMAPPPGADAGAPPPPPAAPPAGPSASPAGPPPADDSAGPTLKAEIPSGDKLKSPGPENGENPLHKAEMAELNKKVDEANAMSAALLAVVKKVVEKPLRKSVQFLSDITPAPTGVDVTKMKREEIRAKLKVVASSTSLKKSDRDLITGYDLNTVKADQIAHLLK